MIVSLNDLDEARDELYRFRNDVHENLDKIKYMAYQARDVLGEAMPDEGYVNQMAEKHIDKIASNYNKIENALEDVNKVIEYLYVVETTLPLAGPNGPEDL